MTTTVRSTLGVIPGQIPEKCLRVMSGELVEATASPGQVTEMSSGAMKVTRAGVEPNGTTSEQAAAAPVSGHVHLPTQCLCLRMGQSGSCRPLPGLMAALVVPHIVGGTEGVGGERSTNSTSSNRLWIRDYRSRRK